MRMLEQEEAVFKNNIICNREDSKSESLTTTRSLCPLYVDTECTYPAIPKGGGGSGGAAGGLKFTVADTCERIKEEFNFIQQQYHSLKLECEKLASEKTEMQRHYVMYYEMSYGLNVEMHKQTEIAKRLNAIIVQLLPFLAQEHQQQVANAVERAKQVTMSELNAIIGQQIHAQQLPHGAVVGGLPPGGLLGFAGAAAAAAAAGVPPHLAPPAHPAAAAAAVQAQAQALLKPADLQQHRAAAETPEDRKPIALTDERLRQSVSPPEKFRTRTPDLESDPKRRKEEKLGHDHEDKVRELGSKRKKERKKERKRRKERKKERKRRKERKKENDGDIRVVRSNVSGGIGVGGSGSGSGSGSDGGGGRSSGSGGGGGGERYDKKLVGLVDPTKVSLNVGTKIE
ncbi:hypothetical protein HZH68_010490 [Vespula germanica]|uniref:Groucho/TLE N-terminal Q-rich domain-containing protein n=1 Tax=Vespula germanica TaxID=30212 RepID=A0A834JU46_VESGE|nr:hypothetical protein HZH68_010490 [Vespula germanica]